MHWISLCAVLIASDADLDNLKKKPQSYVSIYNEEEMYAAPDGEEEPFQEITFDDLEENESE